MMWPIQLLGGIPLTYLLTYLKIGDRHVCWHQSVWLQWLSLFDVDDSESDTSPSQTATDTQCQHQSQHTDDAGDDVDLTTSCCNNHHHHHHHYHHHHRQTADQPKHHPTPHHHFHHLYHFYCHQCFTAADAGAAGNHGDGDDADDLPAQYMDVCHSDGTCPHADWWKHKVTCPWSDFTLW